MKTGEDRDELEEDSDLITEENIDEEEAIFWKNK